MWWSKAFLFPKLWPPCKWLWTWYFYSSLVLVKKSLGKYFSLPSKLSISDDTFEHFFIIFLYTFEYGSVSTFYSSFTSKGALNINPLGFKFLDIFSSLVVYEDTKLYFSTENKFFSDFLFFSSSLGVLSLSPSLKNSSSSLSELLH